MGLLAGIMSAADSAENKKLVAEQRFPVRIRHKDGDLPFFGQGKRSNRVKHDG